MTKKSSGFTLVELSVVLVIIGLLAAGILVGKDLIYNATIHAQIRQVSEYNLAINTFRIKYNAVPGDMLATEAAANGFVARSGARGHGDGNGILEHCNPWPAFTEVPVGCEFVLFWSDLSLAHLISMQPTPAVDGDYVANSFLETTQYYPVLKLFNSATFLAATNLATAGTWLVTVHITQHNAANTMYTQHVIPPNIAYDLDLKMDDGLPTSGLVQVFESNASGLSGNGYFFVLPAATMIGPDKCLLSTTQYNNLSTAAWNANGCQLDIKMGS